MLRTLVALEGALSPTLGVHTAAHNCLQLPSQGIQLLFPTSVGARNVHGGHIILAAKVLTRIK